MGLNINPAGDARLGPSGVSCGGFRLHKERGVQVGGVVGQIIDRNEYYRAAQINRDICFTCPVLDFAWQYVKNGGVEPSPMGLYEHNATRFTPVFEKMGVPMWRVWHLEGGADNPAAQLELGKTISRCFATFASSGSPEGTILLP